MVFLTVLVAFGALLPRAASLAIGKNQAEPRGLDVSDPNSYGLYATFRDSATGQTIDIYGFGLPSEAGRRAPVIEVTLGDSDLHLDSQLARYSPQPAFPDLVGHNSTFSGNRDWNGVCKRGWGCLTGAVSHAWIASEAGRLWTVQTCGLMTRGFTEYWSANDYAKVKDAITMGIAGASLGVLFTPLGAIWSNYLVKIPEAGGKVDTDPDACGVMQVENLYNDIMSASTASCHAILAASKQSNTGDLIAERTYFAGDFLDDKTGVLGDPDGKIAMVKAFLSSRQADFGPFCSLHGVELRQDGTQSLLGI